MRISSIYIDGFGIFHDVSLSGLDPGILIFHGNNEAGKSTLLSFIRTILFGFPRANSRDPNYPPLFGGTHGGRIGLVRSNGEEFIVERKPGKGGGVVSVLGPNGYTGENELLSRLLGGVTYEVFKNIYAFSLAELQTMNTLREEGVKNVIYGAVAGTAMLALPKADKQIKERLEGLFKPGGSKPVINKMITELEGIRSELREASKETSKYDQACGELRQVEEGIRGLRHELARISRDKERFGSYGRLWEEWIALQRSEADFQKLGEVVESFPENGIARLEKENASLENHEKRLVELQDGLYNLRKEAGDLAVDEGLLNQTDVISLLLEKKSEYIEERKALPLSVQEKKAIEAEIQGLIDSLGKDWSVDAVMEIDRSLFTREAIRKQEEGFNQLDRELAATEKVLTENKARYESSVQEEIRAREVIERLGEPGPERNEQVILKLQHGRDEFDGIIHDIPNLEGELRQELKQLTRLVKEIDPGWTEADVNDFDISITAQKKFEDFAARFKQSENDLREAETLRRTTDSHLNGARGKYKTAISKLDKAYRDSVSSREELDRRKSAFHALRSDLLRRNEITREIRHQEERLSDKTGELSRLKEAAGGVPINIFKWVTTASAVLGVLVSGLLILLGKLIEAGIMGGILFAVAIGSFVFRRKFDRQKKSGLKAEQSLADHIEQEIDGINTALNTRDEEIRKLNMEIIRCAKDMNLSESITVDDLNPLENQVEEDIRIFEQKVRLSEEAEGLDADVKKWERDLADAKNRFDRCKQSLDTIEREWKGHLKEIKLSHDLTPALTIFVFGKVETARQQLNGINVLRDRIRKMGETRDKYMGLAGKVPSLEEFCRGPAPGLLSEVDKVFTQLKEQQRVREERRLAEQRFEEKRKLKEEAQKDLKEAQRTRDEAARAKTRVLDNWRAWLVERGLSGDLSARTALEAFDKINDCSEKITRKTLLETKIEGLEREIESYQENVCETLGKLGRAKPDAGKIAVVADKLVSELDESKGNLRERDRIKSEVGKTESQLKTVEGEIRQCRERISSLFKEGGVNNKDEFERRGNLFSKKNGLIQEISLARKNMQKISGESDIDALRKTLDTLTLEEIQTQEKELSLKAEDKEHELNDLRNKRAELRQSIEVMKSADDIARLRTKEEGVLAEMQQAAFDWARYAAARYLINRARERFEKEQQPRVIRDAGVFFRKITDSRYTELFAPIGEDTLEVITLRKERRKPEELSRGTAEQLYLSIRFGYIRNRAESSEPLPVLMDDILVNFDPIRVREAAEAILRLSKDQQVLFFTCHPETIDIFKRIDDQIPLYVMKDSDITLKNRP